MRKLVKFFIILWLFLGMGCRLLDTWKRSTQNKLVQKERAGFANSRDCERSLVEKKAYDSKAAQILLGFNFLMSGVIGFSAGSAVVRSRWRVASWGLGAATNAKIVATLVFIVVLAAQIWMYTLQTRIMESDYILGLYKYHLLK